MSGYVNDSVDFHVNKKYAPRVLRLLERRFELAEWGSEDYVVRVEKTTVAAKEAPPDSVTIGVGFWGDVGAGLSEDIADYVRKLIRKYALRATVYYSQWDDDKSEEWIGPGKEYSEAEHYVKKALSLFGALSEAERQKLRDMIDAENL